MKKTLILIIFFIIIHYLAVIASPAFALGQFNPQPGVNCGVPFDLGDNVNFDPKDPNHQKYSCCYPSISSLSIDTSYVTTNTIIDRALIPIIDFINGRINDMPFFFIPGASSILPTFGRLKQALVNSNAPCLQPANPVGGEPGKSDLCHCQSGASTSLYSLVGLCDRIENKNEQQACKKCIDFDPVTKTYNKEGGGLWTGIGCVKTTFSKFVQETLLGFSVGIAGLIALLCIIYSAFNIQISAGNAEKVKKAQELLTSCIMGLMLIIFSIFILRLIGVEILRIPGFGK